MRAGPRAIPPKISRQPSLGFFAGIVSVAAILGAVAVVFFFNPATHGFYPVCLFHRWTGLNCPGCGGTRAVYALLHGHFQRALKDNALFIVSLGATAIWSVRFAFQKLRKQKAALSLPPGILWAFLAAAIVFTVLRNLSAFSWLSP
jgi:hypothetical protein